MTDTDKPQTTAVYNRWPPSNTAQHRKDFGCFTPCGNLIGDAATCWCGADVIAGYGQCEQCRSELS